MYYVYVIKSLQKNYTYVGLTANTDVRIAQHNAKKEKTTRPYAPFEILLIEQFGTRPEARRRERYLKSGVGREYLKSL